MPTAELVQIADAAVTALNGHAFSAPYQSPGFVRRYDAVEGLEVLAVLAASVIPRGGSVVMAQATASRRYDRIIDRRISVVLQKHVPSLDSTAMDALILLAQEVQIFLATAELPGIAARPIEVLDAVEFDEDRVRQFRLFEGGFTVTYRRPW